MRTYTGRSRSFLVELPMQHGLPNDPGGDQEDSDLHESYSDLRHRWGLDNPEDDPLTPDTSNNVEDNQLASETIQNGMMNDLRSIGELRNKGESRRFLDEIGYWLEGMEQARSIMSRRSSALEFVTKFCDVDFARRVKAADFLQRAWDALQRACAGNGDQILNIILAFFAALIARDPLSLRDLADKTDLVPTLCRVLDTVGSEDDDLIMGVQAGYLKRSKNSRLEKHLLTNLLNTISAANILPEATTVSTRLLVSQTLITFSDSRILINHIASLRRNLLIDLSPLKVRLSAYIQGISLLAPGRTGSTAECIPFEHIQNGLFLFDTFLIGKWLEGETEAARATLSSEQDLDLADGLISLCIISQILADDPQFINKRRVVRRCAATALRILVNLTHDDPRWSEIFVSRGYTIPLILRTINQAQSASFSPRVPDDCQEAQSRSNATYAFHSLCLALGLLTNLVQATDEAKEQLNKSLMGVRCRASPSCVQSCHCPDRISALKCLLSVYLRQCETDEEKSSSFIQGHIALLLGMMIIHSRESQSLVLSSLPGRSDKVKLDSLATHVREFATVYADTISKVTEAQKILIGNDYSHDRCHAYNATHVTRQVIIYLEELRNAQL